jgi:cellulose synthase/poly-beta-1,6-N-acetylglucosamine synthase-like glycosyltransferase
MLLKLVSEPERHGMVPAINHGLKYAVNEVIIKTDADCMLLRDSIKNAIKYLADEKVGSVAGLHIIEAHRKTNPVKVEKTYRNFYKWLRLGESKLYSTVLYEGELMLVKKKLLEKIGGFNEEIGADDSPLALRLAEQGYRAITAESAFFVELTPYTWEQRFQQKVRRARHTLQALWKFKHLNFRDTTPLARIILPMETYIYVVNPLLAILLTILSITVFIKNLWILPLLLFFAFTFLVLPWFRNLMVTHATSIFIMLVAMAKEIVSKELTTWKKIDEIR